MHPQCWLELWGSSSFRPRSVLAAGGTSPSFQPTQTRPKEPPAAVAAPRISCPSLPLQPTVCIRSRALLILTFLPGVRTMGGAGVGMMAVGGMAWGNGVKVCWCVC